jgi:hypothetical protein
MAYLSTYLRYSAQKPGVEFKVMQELMRHSSLRTTLDVYTQAVGPAKRAAQAAVLSLFASPEYSEGDDEIIGTA